MITSLPLDGWPADDRLAWLRACEPGVGWRRGGAASRWKPITREDLERRYGYFLESLRERGALDPQAGAGRLVTPENVDCYIKRVRSGWTSVTLAGSVRKLQTMARILAPASDLEWLTEIANDLDLVAYPLERFDRIVLSEVLIRAGLTLVKEAQVARSHRPIRRAGQIRDGPMIAMLAFCPIRLKNFSELELGHSFVRERDRWTITLPGVEVKNGRTDLRLIRQRLNPAIGLYLTWARPRLMRHTGEFMIGEEQYPLLTGPLWVGQYGEALSYGSVERRIMETTRFFIGRSLSPHDFQRSGAFTARYRAGSEPHLASGLLQHQDKELVDENYNLASSLEVADLFGEWIDNIAGS
ncbi:site-specific integrase [Microvirga aerilata]|jgi:integrase|uniref:Site-specific integrase n=1 Tax=Microvirga aerilata TaxID=670292 RepID=A0A936ZBI6_9HYPH|nr:site-specific integrase [Microvirga aerilata]MBL0408408.1 site-specific integrase [Microvirga aerilata]